MSLRVMGALETPQVLTSMAYVIRSAVMAFSKEMKHVMMAT